MSVKNTIASLNVFAGADSPENFNRRAGIVLLVSGLFGVYLGAFVYPTIQYGIEYAQAVSGIVKYPFGIPEGLIKTHIWSLPVQLSALGLKAGLSEDTLSVIISGLHGMLSFQALGLLLFAINGRVWVSALAPVLFLYSRVTAFPSVYPVLLVGFFATPGALGLSYVLFMLAVFAVGWKRLGAVLLGLAPAWHGVLGGFMWMAIPVGWVWSNKKWTGEIRSLSKWFVVGFSITLTSLCALWIYRLPLPVVSSPNVKRLFIQFIHVWDYHRQPVDFSSYNIFLNLMGLAVCGVSLSKYGCVIPERVRLVLRALTITGVLALAFGVMTHLPVSWVPMILIRAMPARLLDVFVISYPAIMLGILTRKGAGENDQIFATGMVILLLFSCIYPQEFNQFVLFAMLVASSVMVIGAALFSARISQKNRSRSLYITAAKRVQVLIVIAVAAASLTALRTAIIIPSIIYKIKTFDVRKETSKSGVLLVSSALGNHVQYILRSPILLDVSQLDTLCYVPKLLPAAAAILDDVYGIDFFNPPYESRHRAELLPKGVERKLWESRSREEWMNVSKKYQVDAVAVPSDWRLALPLEWSKLGAAIYHIPIDE